MNLVELDRALRQLRLSGMAAVLETRLRQAQTEKMAPLDLVSALVADELRRRQDRLLERRHKLARFRDPERSLDTFDFDFNKKMNRALVYELATARFIAQREDVLFLGPPGSGKSHLAQAIGRAAILQGYRVVYREAHTQTLLNVVLFGLKIAGLVALLAVIVTGLVVATRAHGLPWKRPLRWSLVLSVIPIAGFAANSRFATIPTSCPRRIGNARPNA